ncbi:MAG TPA: HAMP domain-containing protein [Caldithrix abyssi]|uniref:HAMP domain-containing protein n=1 Tax=Caldithrix abyssi TaxID=187145 RepID=A0A7V1LX53_CALAY|nr:HAMP domain-containing protein [Caldithrix abyssi]
MTIGKKFRIFCTAFGLVVLTAAVVGLTVSEGYETFIYGLAFSIIMLITVGYGMLAKMLLSPLAVFEARARQIAEGDLDCRIPFEGNDELGSLAASINSMVDRLNRNHKEDQGYIHEVEQVLTDVSQLVDELKNGRLNRRTTVTTSYENLRDLQNGLNDAIDTLVTPIIQTSTLLEEYARGNLQRNMVQLPGELSELTRAISDIRLNLSNLTEDSKKLASAALEGDFSIKGEADRYSGQYREVIDALNQLFEHMLKPLHEADSIIAELSKGNFAVYSQGSYRGEHARLHETLNRTITDFNRLLGQISALSRQINDGVSQIAENNESLAHGATRQAASIQQISSAIEELTNKTHYNSENADQANNLVRKTKSFTESGNARMHEMLNAMNEISGSSEKISKIINSIEEIAFQTNLLALNAAVEAARAGVHGKGFAVVAEEVRNLAQRSARAANETTELIEDTVSKVQNGTKIANETAGALEQISGQISKVSDLVQEITHSSKEQTENIVEIQSSIREIDGVTQENTASAEESAATSQEMASHVKRLQQMMARFKLDPRFLSQTLPARVAPAADDLKETYTTQTASGKEHKSAPVGAQEAGGESEAINIELDDHEFGEF